MFPYRNSRQKKLFILISIFVTLTIFMLIMCYVQGINLGTFRFSYESEYSEENLGIENVEVKCKMPKMDPMDSVKNIFKKVGDYHCSGHPSFVVLKPPNTLKIDKNILKRYYGDVVLKSCKYRSIHRDPNENNDPDNKQIYLEHNNSEFKDEIRVDEEFVQVLCSDNRDNLILEEFVSLIIEKPNVEEYSASMESEMSEDRLSVQFVVIDSVSKMNFLRHFTKTKKLLKKLKAIDLRMYNKVGTNTIVNMVPLFTGRYVEKVWKQSETPFFDGVDFIWKEYAKRGYRTLLSEDAPDISCFNYKKKGFKKPPAHYYFRPMANAIEHSDVKKHSMNWHCIRDKMEFNYVLDWAHDFIVHFKNKTFFSYAFLSRLTHDLINYAGYADTPSYEFINKLYEKKETMNKTVLIFMSDHGIRFGDILKSYAGQLELRLPFMFIIFPDWFLKKYPEIRTNLKTNQNRLTNPFDMYETLKQILEISTKKPYPGFKSPGISIMRSIPANRTCEDATISNHFCACHDLKPVNSTDKLVQRAAKSILTFVNNATSTERDKCVELELHSILSARMSLTSDIENKGSNSITIFRIVIKTTPSMAEFEATISYFSISDKLTFDGSVSRVNKYGNQSSCISNYKLAIYCFCKQYLKTNNL